MGSTEVKVWFLTISIGYFVQSCLIFEKMHKVLKKSPSGAVPPKDNAFIIDATHKTA